MIPGTATLPDRLRTRICKRAFSSPEALLYEASIAPGVTAIVEAAIADDVTGPFVLDVGCGGGRLARALRGSARVVIGIDPSWSQVRRTVKRAGVAIRASSDGLPFREATFNTVVASCSLKHWNDQAAGLQECARVVRPGGRVVIVEIDGGSTTAEVTTFAARTRIPHPLRRSYVEFAMRTVVGVAPTRDQLEGLVRRSQLEIRTIRRLEGLPFIVVVTELPPSI